MFPSRRKYNCYGRYDNLWFKKVEAFSQTALHQWEWFEFKITTTSNLRFNYTLRRNSDERFLGVVCCNLSWALSQRPLKGILSKQHHWYLESHSSLRKMVVLSNDSWIKNRNTTKPSRGYKIYKMQLFITNFNFELIWNAILTSKNCILESHTIAQKSKNFCFTSCIIIFAEKTETK